MAEEVHRAKGKVKSFLGHLTGDRQVEAEGEAEKKVADEPDAGVVEDEQQRVKEKYGETPAG